MILETILAGNTVGLRQRKHERERNFREEQQKGGKDQLCVTDQQRQRIALVQESSRSTELLELEKRGLRTKGYLWLFSSLFSVSLSDMRRFRCL